MNVFLDFDGTLADSSKGIYLAFVRACKKVGILPPSFNDFRPSIGPPIEVIASNLIPQISPACLEALRLHFRADYDNIYYTHVKWYNGVVRCLRELCCLSCVNVSIVTNKPTNPTVALVESAGVADLFEYIIGVDYRILRGAGAVFASKSEAISYALALTECTGDRAIYLGDTLSDKRACQDNGVSFIAATYGFHSWTQADLQNVASATSFVEAANLVRSMAA